MSFSEIFSDALRYPISEPSKFLIIGVIALIASLTSSITNYSTNIALLVVLGIVSVIASFFLIGYGVSVINSAFNGSSDVPELDFVKNIVDGIKAFVINVIYFIIPILVFIILMLISGVAVGGNMSGIVAVGIVNLIIAFIVFVIFAILGEIAIAKFAKTGDISVYYYSSNNYFLSDNCYVLYFFHSIHWYIDCIICSWILCNILY